MKGTLPDDPPPAGWRRVIDWPFAVAEREPVVMALGLALAAGCWLYRAVLAWTIYTGVAEPPGLRPAAVPVPAFLATLGNDWLVVLVVTLIFLAFKLWFRARLPRLMASDGMQTAEAGLAALLVLGFSLVLVVHGRLVLELQTGLTWTFLQMAHGLAGSADFLRLFNLWDAAFLAAPMVIFAVAMIDRDWVRKSFRRVVLVMTLVEATSWPAP